MNMFTAMLWTFAILVGGAAMMTGFVIFMGERQERKTKRQQPCSGKQHHHVV